MCRSYLLEAARPYCEYGEQYDRMVREQADALRRAYEQAAPPSHIELLSAILAERLAGKDG